MEQNLYATVLDSLTHGVAMTVETLLEGEEGPVNGCLTRRLTQFTPVTDPRGRKCGQVHTEFSKNAVTIWEPMLPKERLIVLGGGHIALPVCEFAAKCGFSVYVADDRPAFANRDRFPLAEQVLCDTFENSIRRLEITPYDFIVVITRGHVHDADCLRVILSGIQPAYLGLIGSRRRVRGLMQMLEQEGYSKEKMDRICTPIGLEIGAVTPGEIAVSILSQVIAYKRLPEHSIDGIRCCNDSDLELNTIETLAAHHGPKSVVTVIETKGSTPREAGAKMIVEPNGRIYGSIGGGCSEGAVIRDAIDLIGTGRYKIVSIDLTGEVAESEGMVCGGTMKVLIEDVPDL